MALGGVLLQEVQVKDLMEQGLQFLHGRENCHSEVVSAFSLSKATARHNTDASLLQEFHVVNQVWSHFMGLSRLHGLGRDENPRERIHSSLQGVALDPWDLVKQIFCQLCFFGQITKDEFFFLMMTKSTGISDSRQGYVNRLTESKLHVTNTVHG